MRQRHRIPVIFSLSMLDVLCCGMGAVIFLMILYSWEARRQASALALTRERVGATSRTLEETQAALNRAQTDQAKGAQTLRATQEALLKTEADLRARREEAALLMARLQQKEVETEDLRNRLAMREENLARVSRELAAKETERLSAQNEAGMLALELDRKQAALQKTLKDQRDAESTAALVPTLRADLAAARADLAAADKRVKDLNLEVGSLRKRAEEASTQMTEAQRMARASESDLESLRRTVNEQKAVAGVLRRQLTEAEGRFAGVDLVGKRVVLLVDTSGSMGSLDTNTPATDKWPEVCRTVAHVLSSMPQVEAYQVILFADDVRYLLGRSGEWNAYDPKQTPEQVRTALLSVKPSGNTNMYAAFEAAFRYRPMGLDTIFVLSDGLPNVGAGLPTPPPADENLQATLLSKHLRDTIRTRWNSGTPRVRINAIGFFYESPNLGSFLWGLTRENGGSFVGMSKP